MYNETPPNCILSRQDKALGLNEILVKQGYLKWKK